APPPTLGTANLNANGVNTAFGGPLTLNRDVVLQAGSTDRTTFTGLITGSGAVTITSPFAAGRRVVFDRPTGASNTFAGGLTLSTNAWLQLGAPTSLGNRTLPDGLVLQFSPGAQLRLAPAGSGDTELIGALNSTVANAGLVDLISSTLFTLQLGGGDASGTFGGTLLNSAGSLALTKVGAGRQILAGPNSFTGWLSVFGGTLVAAHGGALGATGGGTTVSPGASLGLSNNITIAAESLTLNGDGVPDPLLTLQRFNASTLNAQLSASGALLNESGANAFNGPITLGSPSTVGALSGALTLAGPWNTGGNAITFNAAEQASILIRSPIGGSGGLVKRGLGVVTLSGANTFSGTTRLLEGTLVLNAGGSLASSSNLVLAQDATLDVSALNGAWTLAQGQTLQGEGTINGPALMTGLLLPGGSVGSLRVTGDTTLAGQVLMEIGRFGASLTNDQLLCAASLNLGGTLTVTNLGPDPLLAGDSFRLFTASLGSGGFSTLELPVLRPGLLWDTSTLATDGTLRVMMAEPSEPPRLSLTVAPRALTFSWPTNYLSFILQAQTNAPGQGLGATWHPVPGLSNNTLTVPLDGQNGSVFYRLMRP
ncbi:MAG TPA: autotransporter-associated beta strand repeat-containing protein, partial [Candidatus Sulfotelmatobacter sp.]|nr:autotransporter-associated beta strand repeat-containing protein [Candidatus Sulfotelmatobacter sp.]